MRWGKKLVGLIAVNSVILIVSQNITHSNAEEAPYIQHKLQICRAQCWHLPLKIMSSTEQEEVPPTPGSQSWGRLRRSLNPPLWGELHRMGSRGGRF